MSKGPGKWQMMILSELEKRKAFLFKELLPEDHTRAQYNALHRAMQTLKAAGRCNEWHSWRHETTIIHRIGTTFDWKDWDSFRIRYRR